jgi:hypothetical protein
LVQAIAESSHWLFFHLINVCPLYGDVHFLVLLFNDCCALLQFLWSCRRGLSCNVM